MQPDPIRVEEASAWLEKSRKDLWRAENVLTLDPPDTEDCLFHCQQAVEKSLKALLVWRDHPFRKTHDLVELTRQCVDLEPTLDDVLRGVAGLTEGVGAMRRKMCECGAGVGSGVDRCVKSPLGSVGAATCWT